MPEIEEINQPAEIIAAIFGITKSRIRQLVKEGLPKSGRNRYPMVACIRWYVDFWKNRADVPDKAIKRERARLAKEQADKVALDNQQRRKDLLPAADVIRAWSDHIVNAKTKLTAIPSKIAPIAADTDDPRKIQAEVKTLIDEILNDLADSVPDPPKGKK